MIIKYIEGNLLEGHERVIAHGCNALGVMGAGVALAIRKSYPENFNSYHNFCRVHAPISICGKIHVFTMPERVIVNMITQQSVGTGRQANLNNIEECFKALDALAQEKDASIWQKNDITENGLCKVGIPKIGSLRGGLNWDEVKEVIEQNSRHMAITCYIYQEKSQSSRY